jgi:membrane associated rhomboid family serine protease
MRRGRDGGIVGGFPLVRPSMFVSLPTRSRPSLRWATPMLFALLWLAYFWARTRSGAAQHALLLDWGALTGGQALTDTLRALWTEGRGLRLLTALFLHADWIHLLGNLVFLLIFGLPAERVMGPWRFLLLFLLGGAIANLAAVLLIGAPHRLVIGASGAVSAVIGAYLALFPRARLGVVLPLGLFLEFVRAPASLLIGIWALLQIVFAYIGPAFGAVAWAAHIAGFGFGVLYALFVRAAIARRLRQRRGY